MRERGEHPRAEDFRALLRACAAEPDPDVAMQAVREMEAEGFTAVPDDHDAVLIAHMARGRADEAESYLRSIRWGYVRPDHIRRVLWALAVQGRADDAVRLFEEYRHAPVVPDRACELTLMDAFVVGRRAADARRWYSRFSPRGEDLEPPFVARLIDAHADPRHRDELRAIHTRLPEPVRRHPEVATALVHAFARIDDPETGEALLAEALRWVRDHDERELMFLAVVAAWERAARGTDVDLDEALERLRSLAERHRVDVEYL